MQLFPYRWFILTEIITALVSTQESLNLIEAVGDVSGYNDGDWSTVGCPEGYTIYSCKCRHPHSNGCDGEWLEYNKCNAYASGHDTSRTGVQAVAQCLAGSLVNLTLVQSRGGWEDKPTASCPGGTRVVSCWMMSPWAHLFDFPDSVMGVDLCTSYGEHTCSGTNIGCKVQGMCSDLEEAFGDRSGVRDDDESTVGCPEGYIIYSCECRHPHHDGCDGVWLENNRCTAFASGNSLIGVQAVAQCLAGSDAALTLVDSGGSWEDNPTASCPVGGRMVSCWLFSSWSPSFNFPHSVMSVDSCTSSVECTVGGDGCKVQGMCYDYCFGNPCGNGGVCSRTSGGGSCSCYEGYQGPTCSIGLYETCFIVRLPTYHSYTVLLDVT